MEEVILSIALTFQWDEGNSTKSWIKHRVSIKEQEQAFFDTSKRVFQDTKPRVSHICHSVLDTESIQINYWYRFPLSRE
mgnify:CR=1